MIGDFVNYGKMLDYIHSLGMFSQPPSLERIKKVLKVLGNPQNSFKSIHIAGTNGKGSVCSLISSVFKTAGYKTGLFISPFIIDFKERIQINGEFISEKDLNYYGERVKETKIALTEFEFITALAFLYFKEKGIDVLVCETGLGGRLDATNTLENLLCTVITKIGLDHTAVLGETIEQITEEKCGILRNCPNITTPFQPESALNIINKKDTVIPDLSALEILKTETDGNTFIYKGEIFETLLSGEYQIENALVAIEAIKNSGCNIPYNIIYEGLKSASFPARLEIISKNPLVVLDGAHNPDGALALERVMKKHSGKITAIIGMMNDKDIDEVLKTTLKHCKCAICVEVPNMPRSLSANELKAKASRFCNSETANSLEEAVALIKNDTVFIFGSLYLAGSIRPLLLKNKI